MASPMTEEEFKVLNAYARGYFVYLFGHKEDEPNVPLENNPFPSDSVEHQHWITGVRRAMLDGIENSG